MSGLLLFSFSNILLLFEHSVTSVYSVRNKMIRMHSLLTFYMVTFSITNGYDCVEWNQRDFIKTIYIGVGEHYLGGGAFVQGGLCPGGFCPTFRLPPLRCNLIPPNSLTGHQ